MVCVLCCVHVRDDESVMVGVAAVPDATEFETHTTRIVPAVGENEDVV
jgi:hypothetical protein